MVPDSLPHISEQYLDSFVEGHPSCLPLLHMVRWTDGYEWIFWHFLPSEYVQQIWPNIALTLSFKIELPSQITFSAEIRQRRHFFKTDQNYGTQSHNM